MTEPYRRRTPSQAARELAEPLPGGRTEADELVRTYLAEATARHGLPDEGWWLDADDLDQIRARHAEREVEPDGFEERGDRAGVLDEGAPSPVGGLWFTPDDTAPGGVRPLTEAELHAITEQVRATQAEALAHDLDPNPVTSRPVDADGETDTAGWER